jgi:hypothetical protein
VCILLFQTSGRRNPETALKILAPHVAHVQEVVGFVKMDGSKILEIIPLFNKFPKGNTGALCQSNLNLVLTQEFILSSQVVDGKKRGLVSIASLIICAGPNLCQYS